MTLTTDSVLVLDGVLTFSRTLLSIGISIDVAGGRLHSREPIVPTSLVDGRCQSMADGGWVVGVRSIGNAITAPTSSK